MNSSQKALRAPCYDVLDWLIDQSDSGETARSAAQTIRQHGLNGDYQEQVLADACTACGMREVCEYANECGIGEIDWQPPAIPGNRIPDMDGGAAGRGNARTQG